MNQTDTELIALIYRGDEHAFNCLYGRYKEVVYNYLLYVEPDVKTVEDLFQEIWIKVIKKLKEGHTIENFKGWIFKVASNSYKDFLRKKRMRRLIFPDKEDAVTEVIADNNTNGTEVKMYVEKAMLKLTPKQKELFYLKEVIGLPYSEITDVLGISETAAKSRMFNAVRNLREELKELREK